MTLEELMEMMYGETDVGIRCSSIEERDRLGKRLEELECGRRGWIDEESSDEPIIFWEPDDECFRTTDVQCSHDVFFADIEHLLTDKPVVPVIVDDLI